LHGLIAGGETLLTNALVFSFNAFVSRMPWAVATPDSIWHNLQYPWIWEDDVDSFMINQFGHPYQGTFYFNSGRVNGFGYYESAIFNLLGSVTWEIFGETEHAAVNDLITTVIGSMSLGEMLYRLYLEAYAAGVPAFLAIFINPMASFHRLTGWKVPDAGRNLYELKYYTGGGYSYTDSSASTESQKLYNNGGPYASAGVNMVYGNPFEQDSIIPYRHFELDASVGLGITNHGNQFCRGQTKHQKLKGNFF
jgi:hypothetical protein